MRFGAHIRWLLAMGGFLALAGAAWAGGVGGTKKTAEKPRAPEGPLAVFADIEAGWQRHDPNRIVRHFGRGRVTISLEGLAPAGKRFSKHQSYYLFKDLFKYTITRAFRFVRYRNLEGKGGRVYAVAERLYKRRDDGRLFKDKVYVALRREGDRWVVDEIKSIR
jgi:hypothetical protein